MALPFLNRGTKSREQAVAIDLGSRTTKAVHVQRKDGRFSLLHYVMQDAPVYEKSLSPEVLAEHIKGVLQAMGAKTKTVTLALGVGDSLLRNAELPPLTPAEMRVMLKFNTKNYLQQELNDYVFDCHIVEESQASKGEGKSEGAKGPPKLKVWVGGAKKQMLSDLQAAAKIAGLALDQVTLGILGPINAFELAHSDPFKNEVVALVELGYKNSSICIVSGGEMVLTRVVTIGGDKLTTGLSEALGITYAEAEGIKVGMPSEVESSLMPLLSPLGRELRASLDFFEHQQDKTVSQVYVSGAAAQSDFILQALQSEMMVTCVSWNPTSFLTPAVPPQMVGEIEGVAPQLSVAIGSAVTLF